MNRSYPTADATTLMGQASMTAHDYMLNAKHDIDKLFGAGFAAIHPDLVGAYMQVAGADFNAAILAKAIGEGIMQLTAGLRVEIDAHGERNEVGLQEIAGAIAGKSP